MWDKEMDGTMEKAGEKAVWEEGKPGKKQKRK